MKKNPEEVIKKLKETGKLELLRKLLEGKHYDEIYNLFGKTVYMLFTPIEHKKKDIKKLLEENNLALIYQKYGSLETMFIKNFRRLKKEEIKKLLEEKRYVELQNTYGDKVLQEHRFDVYKSDIENETGSKFKAKVLSSGSKTVHNLKEAVKSLAIFTTSLGVVMAGKVVQYMDESYEKMLQDNASIIQDYDEEVTEYADYIQDLQLDSDLEVVMKVMDDMWGKIKYGNPTKDVLGAGRLAFTEAEKVGVCRNIADDFSARMNAINPEYNARNLAVNMDASYYSKDNLANIKRDIQETNETVVDNENNEKNENNNEPQQTGELQRELDEMFNNIDVTKYSGNHMVSIFEPIGKDYTLVVDATNPSIGIIANGEIYMFQTTEGKGLTFKPIGQLIAAKNYDYTDVRNEFLKSFISFKSKEELQEISNEWNLEKQNQALETIRNLKTNESTIEESNTK